MCFTSVPERAIFPNQFEPKPGVPAAVHHSVDDLVIETPPEPVEEPAALDLSIEPAVEPMDLGDRSSLAAEVREVAPDEPLPPLPEGVVRARAEAVSIEHRTNHVRKHPLCDACNRAKLFSKRVCSHRVADPEHQVWRAGSKRSHGCVEIFWR